MSVMEWYNLNKKSQARGGGIPTQCYPSRIFPSLGLSHAPIPYAYAFRSAAWQDFFCTGVFFLEKSLVTASMTVFANVKTVVSWQNTEQKYLVTSHWCLRRLLWCLFGWMAFPSYPTHPQLAHSLSKISLRADYTRQRAAPYFRHGETQKPGHVIAFSAVVKFGV